MPASTAINPRAGAAGAACRACTGMACVICCRDRCRLSAATRVHLRHLRPCWLAGSPPPPCRDEQRSPTFRQAQYRRRRRPPCRRIRHALREVRPARPAVVRWAPFPGTGVLPVLHRRHRELCGREQRPAVLKPQPPPPALCAVLCASALRRSPVSRDLPTSALPAPSPSHRDSSRHLQPSRRQQPQAAACRTARGGYVAAPQPPPGSPSPAHLACRRCCSTSPARATRPTAQCAYRPLRSAICTLPPAPSPIADLRRRRRGRSRRSHRAAAADALRGADDDNIVSGSPAGGRAQRRSATGAAARTIPSRCRDAAPPPPTVRPSHEVVAPVCRMVRIRPPATAQGCRRHQSVKLVPSAMPAALRSALREQAVQIGHAQLLLERRQRHRVPVSSPPTAAAPAELSIFAATDHHRACGRRGDRRMYWTPKTSWRALLRPRRTNCGGRRCVAPLTARRPPLPRRRRPPAQAWRGASLPWLAEVLLAFSAVTIRCRPSLAQRHPWRITAAAALRVVRWPVTSPVCRLLCRAYRHERAAISTVLTANRTTLPTCTRAAVTHHRHQRWPAQLAWSSRCTAAAADLAADQRAAVTTASALGARCVRQPGLHQVIDRGGHRRSAPPVRHLHRRRPEQGAARRACNRDLACCSWRRRPACRYRPASVVPPPRRRRYCAACRAAPHRCRRTGGLQQPP